MRTCTVQLMIHMSPAERRMLDHLAMAERVPKNFILRRLIRDAARELYATIEAANDREARDGKAHDV